MHIHQHSIQVITILKGDRTERRSRKGHPKHRIKKLNWEREQINKCSWKTKEEGYIYFILFKIGFVN